MFSLKDKGQYEPPHIIRQSFLLMGQTSSNSIYIDGAKNPARTETYPRYIAGFTPYFYCKGCKRPMPTSLLCNMFSRILFSSRLFILRASPANLMSRNLESLKFAANLLATNRESPLQRVIAKFPDQPHLRKPLAR